MNHRGSTGDRADARPWHTDWLVLRGLRRLIEVDCAQRLRPGARLVDFGCGSQPYRELISQRGIVYSGADLDAGAELPIGNDGRVPVADGVADGVLSVQVLEHVRDTSQYLAECRRLLRPDGVLFLSTHGTWLFHPHPEDHRRWTRTGLILDVERCGFIVEHVEAVAGPLATTTLIRLTGFAHVLRSIPILGSPLAGFVALVMNGRALIEDALTPASIRQDNGCVYWLRATPA